MIYALHGFLGLPTDWKPILGENVHAVDLYNTKNVDPFWTWAKKFNNTISKNDTNILLGYSLGGRLAIHALIQRPDLWDAAIIVSSHPGLSSESERKIRLKEDQRWAERFKRESWERLMKDWNAQPIFAGETNGLQRDECAFSRQLLADVLVEWSLGKQDDLRDDLQSLSIPILWIAGENDSRCVKIVQTHTLRHPQSSIWIAPNSGHRVPWENKDGFRQRVINFINKSNL